MCRKFIFKRIAMFRQKEHIGRRKGTPNKVTAETKAVLMEIVKVFAQAGKDGATPKIIEYIDSLESPKQKVDVFIAVARILMPSEVNVKAGNGTTVVQRLFDLSGEGAEE